MEGNNLMADIDTLEAELLKRVAGKKPIGKTIAFAIKEEGTLRIDGTSDPVTIARSDEDADATITISAADMMGLLDGSVNGQSLMMTGRAKMKGNPMVAMKLKDLLT
jgi:putative sterol carrier protein